MKLAALLYNVFSGVNLLTLMQLSVLRGSGIEQVLPLQPANQPIEGPYEATFISITYCKMHVRCTVEVAQSAMLAGESCAGNIVYAVGPSHDSSLW